MSLPDREPHESPHRCAACTIVSPNYFHFARTVAASYLDQHPTHSFFVLLVADLDPAHRAAFAQDAFTPVMLADIGLPDLRAAAMRYDILELNTNVKPTFLKHLFLRYHLDRLVYLDPDIFCYSPFTPIFQALENNDVVLTPHMTAPVDDGKSPSEQDLLYNGTYNLGFIAFRQSPQTCKILDWWEARCLTLGFSEGRTGLFVDQKWMNLAPGLFDGVAILRHPGCNMAYWNLQERTLAGTEVAVPDRLPVPLCFFHFSGINLSDPDSLSSNTDRLTLAMRPDLHQLFANYRAVLAGNASLPAQSLLYGFDRFSNGTAITRLARRIYSKHQARFAGTDPFDAAGPFFAYARRHRLVAGQAAAPKTTWNQFSGQDRRVALLHRLFLAALRLLGPNRYELLMRYLAHIAVLRNQSVFLGAEDTGK